MREGARELTPSRVQFRRLKEKNTECASHRGTHLTSRLTAVHLPILVQAGCRNILLRKNTEGNNHPRRAPTEPNSDSFPLSIPSACLYVASRKAEKCFPFSSCPLELYLDQTLKYHCRKWKCLTCFDLYRAVSIRNPAPKPWNT